MNVLGSLGSAIAQNPAIAVGIAELGGSLVGGAMDLFGSKQDREERKERFQEEAKKTSEFLEKEAKLASEERKEVFGLEKERSKEMLDKELDYLSKLADKNIDLFNQYYGNLAKRRQELLAQGLTREEIPEFFNQVLASRQSIMAGASRVPDTYGGASLGSDLGALRMARMQQYQQAFTPLQQPAQLRMRESITPAIRNLGNLYMSYQQQRLGQRGQRPPQAVQRRSGATQTEIQQERRKRSFADPYQSKEYAEMLEKGIAAKKIQKAFRKYQKKKKGMKLIAKPNITTGEEPYSFGYARDDLIKRERARKAEENVPTLKVKSKPQEEEVPLSKERIEWNKALKKLSTFSVEPTIPEIPKRVIKRLTKFTPPKKDWRKRSDASALLEKIEQQQRAVGAPQFITLPTNPNVRGFK